MSTGANRIGREMLPAPANPVRGLRCVRGQEVAKHYLRSFTIISVRSATSTAAEIQRERGSAALAEWRPATASPLGSGHSATCGDKSPSD